MLWTIGLRDDVAIGVLSTIRVSVGVNMLADLEVTALVIVVITLEYSVSLSYVADAWSATFIDVGVLLGARVDFVVDAMADALARACHESGSLSTLLMK